MGQVIVQRGGGLTLPATVVKTDQGNTYSTGAQNFASATSLTVPSSAGAAPTADGSIAYDTTQDMLKAGGAGAVTGALGRVLSVTRPNSQLTNSTTADQDFTTIYTLPANYIIPQRVLRITALIQFVTDGAASSRLYYLKLGSVKIYTQQAAVTPGNSVTRSFVWQALIFGKDAPGASVEVECAINVLYGLNNMFNSVAQPIGGIATNGSLAVILGLAFGTNTTGESETLLSVMLEELN